MGCLKLVINNCLIVISNEQSTSSSIYNYLNYLLTRFVTDRLLLSHCRSFWIFQMVTLVVARRIKYDIAQVSQFFREQCILYSVYYIIHTNILIVRKL